MKLKIITATLSAETRLLLNELLRESLCLMPLELEDCQVGSRVTLVERVRQLQDDLLLLDWDLAGAETPDLVRQMLQGNSRIRIIALLPQQLRQYRQCLWEAGACTSIPKEHLDQEWLSSVLCMARRSVQREARLQLLPK